MRRELSEKQGTIRAWYVEYLGRHAGNSAYLRRVVAMKYPSSLFHSSAKGGAELDWRDDPFPARLFIDGTKCLIEAPFVREFAITRYKPAEGLPGSTPDEVLFFAMGWWALEGVPAKRPGDDRIAALSQIAGSPNYSFGGKEFIDGRRCHVLESRGRDRIWLDQSAGLAIVRRELYDPESGGLRLRINVASLREVASGIWAPAQFSRALFAADPSSGRPGDVCLTDEATIDVVDVRVNDQVRDALFQFEPAPGSLRLEGNRVDVVPGGMDYPVGLADWLKKHAHYSPSPAKSPAPERTVEWAIIGVGGLVLIGACRSGKRRGAGGRRGNVGELAQGGAT